MALTRNCSAPTRTPPSHPAFLTAQRLTPNAEQRALEESQATKRKLRQRALTERLDRRRQEKINAALAAAESAEVQQKVRAFRDMG